MERRQGVHVLDDPSRSRRDRAKGVYVRHNVVAAFLLFHGSDLELLGGKVLCMRNRFAVGEFGGKPTHEVILHLLESFIRDGQAKLFLGSSEVEP